MRSIAIHTSNVLLSIGLIVALLLSGTQSVSAATSGCPATSLLPQQQPSVTQQRHTEASTTNAAFALQIPRGGAWYFGKPTAARKYRQLLQEQVIMLDKQLRQSQDELSLLRRQLKTSQSMLHKTGSPSLRTKSSEQQAEKLKALGDNQEMKKRILSLTREVTALEKMREDLQAIIDNQHKKMQDLEQQLKQEKDASAMTLQKHQRELENLKRDIETKYQKQLADLTALMNKRVIEASEHARQMALKELDQKVEAATVAERTRGQKLLDAEIKRSDAAVEREKVKMRKLAKALFEREKKLNTLDNPDLSSVDSSNIRTTSSPMAGSKTTGKTTATNTVRKF